MNDRSRAVLSKPGLEDGLKIVLLHGYGADAEDLWPLANALSAPAGTGWWAINGPELVPVSPWAHGRAWFPISIQALQQAAAEGDPTPLAESLAPGLNSSRADAIAQLEKIGIWDDPNLVIAGFSQGACLALELAVHRPQPPRAVIAWSPTIANPEVWAERAASQADFPIFMSHGEQDEVLPFAGAEQTAALFRGAGCEVEFLPFRGGHGIAPEALLATGAFLMRL